LLIGYFIPSTFGVFSPPYIGSFRPTPTVKRNVHQGQSERLAFFCANKDQSAMCRGKEKSMKVSSNKKESMQEMQQHPERRDY